MQAVIVGRIRGQLHADVEQPAAIERLSLFLLDDDDPPPRALLAQHGRQRRHELREMLLAVAIRDDDRQAPVGGERQRAEYAAGQERARHARNQFPVRDADGRVSPLDAQSLQRIRAQALAGQPPVQPTRAARRLDRVEKIRDGQDCTPGESAYSLTIRPAPA